MPGLTPTQAYAARVADGRIQADPAQRAILPILDRIHRQTLKRARYLSWLPSIVRRPLLPPPARGLYLHGGVGRGKTFLIDLLYESLPPDMARRVHFHRFMGRIHHDLKGLEDTADPLAQIALRLSARPLLCLDEFLVNDIGDAMILSELLAQLAAHRVSLVTTSNLAPRELYRDGLQRARFLPAIARIEKQCEVVELASPTDYRLRALTREPLYLIPLGDAAEARLAALFLRLAPDAAISPGLMQIHDRAIAFRRRGHGVVWFDFAALCEGPRAVADYLEIAASHHTVILSNIPRFDDQHLDPARRFVHLIDALYDQGVNLIASAAVPVSELYVGSRLATEFGRTQSRLIEMRGEAWLAAAHRVDAETVKAV